MSTEKSFGEIIKNRRRELGLTQDELARRVGCAPITVRKIESDDLRPSVQIAERLAMALNIALEERAGFVRLARAERATPPEASVTPMPAPEEIGGEDLSGRAIRGYALGERIGSGGMGAVYRAVQPLVEREVAVKIILPQFANHPDFIRRFEAEAQLVARLEHPHIVPLYDYWREPGVAYLVMRLLRGGSVQTLLRSGALPPETVLRMMEQIGSALGAAHRAGVVHRDLKPANVLLDEDNNAYLADFGIAKNLSSPTSETNAEAILGSPDYISPEQIRAEYIRPQTDIYSLGVMLYELLTGSVPFRGPTPFDVMHQHISTPLPPLSANRGGLPRVLDNVIEQATAKDPLERYNTVDELLADLRAAMSFEWRDERSITTLPAGSLALSTPLTAADNPYKGLRAFGEGDAPDFFGREALIQQLLVRLGESGELSRFLAVVGPSGSGKSSVVRAGVIPALRRGGLPGSENWFIVELLPGPHPLEELEAALLRIAVNPPASLLEQLRSDKRGLLRAARRCLPDDPSVELALVIDQFEEVFTLVQEEAVRAHLLDLLVTTALDERSRVRIILTLRADFIDRPLSYVDFGELLRQRMEVVLPLNPDELEQAIGAPASRVGLQLEPGLVAAILRDLGDQPGSLPLLEYALTQLFEQREGNLLTRAAYQSIGGVLGALSRKADEVYASLDESAQSAARQLFLRLVTLGEGTEDTRRRVLRAELENLATQTGPFAAVLESFGKARLLSFDRDPLTRGATVEVAHEAILREWGRLREWLAESRSDIRLERQLALAAAEWEGAGQDTSFLLTGAHLAQFEGWATSTSIALTQGEKTFLGASIDERDRRAAEETARQQRELETAQKLVETERLSAQKMGVRNRVITAVGAIALVLAVLAGIFGLQSNQNLKTASAREIAAAAISNLNVDPERSILLALQALDIQQIPEAENALRRSLATSRVKMTLTSEDTVYAVAFSPDGTHLAAAEQNGTIQIWEIQTGKQILKTFSTSGAIISIYYYLNGKYLITGDAGGYIKLWNIETGNLESATMAQVDGINRMALSSDGTYLATAGSDGMVNVLRTETLKTLFTLSAHYGSVTSVAFSNDGTRLATISTDGQAKIWDTATGEKVFTISLAKDGGWPNILFSADGSRLITSDSANTVQFWDISGNDAREIFHRNNFNSQNTSLLLSPDGTRLIVGQGTGISVWDALYGFDLFAIPTYQYSYFKSISPDGELLAAGTGRAVEIWNLSVPGEKQALVAHNGFGIGSVAFSPDGRKLATESTPDQTTRIWDVNTGKELLKIQSADFCCSVAFSPDGTLLAIGSVSGFARVWDLANGKVLALLSAHSDIVEQVAFSSDGTRIATASDDGTAKLFDASTRKNLFTIPVRDGGIVLGVDFSPDGKILATSSMNSAWEDGEVKIWEATTGNYLFSIGNSATQSLGTTKLAFSPNGKFLAVGYSDSATRVWGISTQSQRQQPVQEFRGNAGLVWGVAFSPDGLQLATAYQNGEIKIWDIASGQEVTDIADHSSDTTDVAFSPDGRYLASASFDGTLRVYFTRLDDLVAYAKTRVTRSLTKEECQKYLHMDTCPGQ